MIYGYARVSTAGQAKDGNSLEGQLTNVLLAFAEFERDMIVERTQSGKEIAKQNPDFKEGRPRKYTDDEIARAIEMLETESYRKVAKNTGISVSTLVRVKNG